MLIPPRDSRNTLLFDETYKLIKEHSLSSSGCTILIFVAPYCDALCACSIFTNLLRSDEISYKVRPVSGYEDLYTAAKEELSNEDLRSIILIECGATVDIGELFGLNESHNDKVFYIIDSHRPLHLNNIYFNEQVVILYDGKPSISELPEAELIVEAREEAWENYAQHASEDEEDTSEYEDEEEHDEEHIENSSRVARGIQGKEHEEGDGAGVGKGVLQYSSSAPDRKQYDAKLADMLKKRARTRIERSYYGGEGSGDMGTSSAGICYELATQINKHSNELVWLAILGLTDQYLHGCIDESMYLKEQEKFRTEVEHFNPASTEGEVRRGVGENTGNSRMVSGGYTATSFAPSSSTSLESGEGGGIVSLPPHRRTARTIYIEASEEHWTLYSAMMHSRFVGARLGIWKSGGVRRLEILLAKAGIALTEAKQAWGMMSVEARTMVNNNLQAQADAFNLHNMTYPSFTMCQGTSPTLSATDVVYAVTALMEFAHGWDEDVDRDTYEKNFWAAYDSLSHSSRRTHNHSKLLAGVVGASSSVPSPTLLNPHFSRVHIGGGGGGMEGAAAGIGIAVGLHQMVVQVGASMIEKAIIVHSGPFRYAFVPESAERYFFARPLALRTLALFLVEYLNERNTVYKPLLVLCLDEESNSYLIAAMANSYTYSNFGACFKKAAARTKAHVCHHAFDSSLLNVDQNDTRKFLDYLLYYFIQKDKEE